MKILPRKRKYDTYQNKLWCFSLDLGTQWYEPEGLLWWLQRTPASTAKAPVFRHEHFPIQANIVIGNIPNVSSLQEQHRFAVQHYGGQKFISEASIEILGREHYTVALMLGGILPTKKYSLVFIHPKRNIPIEFVFTVSIYASIDEFEHLIENGDDLVKSFQWLGQGGSKTKPSESTKAPPSSIYEEHQKPQQGKDDLYRDLLLKTRNDSELADRLIEYERKQKPNASEIELIRNAITRWEWDNR